MGRDAVHRDGRLHVRTLLIAKIGIAGLAIAWRCRRIEIAIADIFRHPIIIIAVVIAAASIIASGGIADRAASNGANRGTNNRAFGAITFACNQITGDPADHATGNGPGNRIASVAAATLVIVAIVTAIVIIAIPLIADIITAIGYPAILIDQIGIIIVAHPAMAVARLAQSIMRPVDDIITGGKIIGRQKTTGEEPRPRAIETGAAMESAEVTAMHSAHALMTAHPIMAAHPVRSTHALGRKGHRGVGHSCP